MEGKYIIVSGPIIIENNKILLIKDEKDDFYKLPGGTVEENETPENTCHREVKEEINGIIELKNALSPIVLWKNPKNGEKMTLILLHFSAILTNPKEIKPIPPIKEINWIKISDLSDDKHKIAPNIKILIEKRLI